MQRQFRLISFPDGGQWIVNYLYNESKQLEAQYINDTFCVPDRYFAFPESVKVGDSGYMYTLNCDASSKREVSYTVEEQGAGIMTNINEYDPSSQNVFVVGYILDLSGILSNMYIHQQGVDFLRDIYSDN